MQRWQGRTALVTGASSGIGKDITIDLLNSGLNVVACARRVDAVEAIKNEVDSSNEGVGELMAVKCDVSKEEEILAMFDQIKASKFGGVDVCVNNAGFGKRLPLREGKTEDWVGMLNVNVLGLSICTREALKSMKERDVDDGHIIHISSVGAYNVFPTASMYCATKHAVRALTEGLRQELLAEKSGIRVTEICPGLVKTEFIKTATAGAGIDDRIFESANYLTGSDVSASVLYALSAPKHVQVHDIIIHPVKQPQQ